MSGPGAPQIGDQTCQHQRKAVGGLRAVDHLAEQPLCRWADIVDGTVPGNEDEARQIGPMAEFQRAEKQNPVNRFTYRFSQVREDAGFLGGEHTLAPVQGDASPG